jgi:hypothetical protein
MERGRGGSGLLDADMARRCASREIDYFATRVLFEMA